MGQEPVSRSKGSAARARACSMVRVYSSRKAWRPAEDRGCFLPRMRFTSLTQVFGSRSALVRSLPVFSSSQRSPHDREGTVGSELREELSRCAGKVSLKQ